MPRVGADHALNLPPIEVRRDGARRLFDVVFALAALLVTSPILLLASMAIRLSSRGPVLYSKPVYGRGGYPMGMLKFRTMYVDAEQRLAGIISEDPARALEWEREQKLRVDPRITPLGALLRKFSIDELPQLWNVLRGEMSVVGPRPYFSEDTRYVGDQAAIFRRSARKILSVRPGITGIWATSGRANLSFTDRVRLDALYVDGRSTWCDTKIILMTIPVVLLSRGAR